MASSARVLSIQALEDLKAGLVRFGSEAQDALNQAEQEIRRTQEWLQERLRYWQGEVRRRQEAVMAAAAALERCLAASDSGRGCRGYEAALVAARRRLAEAQAELANLQKWMGLVQQAVAEYQREAQRLSALVQRELPNATALLGRQIESLHSYAGLGAPVTEPFLAEITGPSSGAPAAFGSSVAAYSSPADAT